MIEIHNEYLKLIAKEVFLTETGKKLKLHYLAVWMANFVTGIDKCNVIVS